MGVRSMSISLFLKKGGEIKITSQCISGIAILEAFTVERYNVKQQVFPVNRCLPTWTQLRGPNRALNKNYNKL